MNKRQFRLARIWSNGQLRTIGALVEGTVVNVSAGEDIDKEGSNYVSYFPGAKEYWITNYAPGAYRGFQGRPQELLLDLRDELPEKLERRFDVVFNHTTLEHVFDVRLAFANLCRLSRDLVIVVVPFAQVQHESEAYQDFWRFTPTCIRRLFSENGLEVVYEAVSPDVNAAVYLFFVGSRSPDRWRPVLPKNGELQEVGDWIGAANIRWPWLARTTLREWVARIRRGLRGRNP